MKEYILTLISAALLTSLVGILAPDGERGGIARHMRLLIALFMVSTLISPIRGLLAGLRDWSLGNGTQNPSEQVLPIDPSTTLQDTLQGASEAYFSEMLTQAIEASFAIEVGDVRCTVVWQDENGERSPSQIRVFLSGRAIWKDPDAIEAFVHELLGCECIIAIE